MDRFRAEYERLHRAIQKQHGSILDLLTCALGVIASAFTLFRFHAKQVRLIEDILST